MLLRSDYSNGLPNVGLDTYYPTCRKVQIPDGRFGSLSDYIYSPHLYGSTSIYTCSRIPDPSPQSYPPVQDGEALFSMFSDSSLHISLHVFRATPTFGAILAGQVSP